MKKTADIIFLSMVLVSTLAISLSINPWQTVVNAFSIWSVWKLMQIIEK